MNENEIYTAILSGAVDSGLDRIVAAVSERRKMVGSMNVFKIKVGDRVRLYNLRERQLNNQIGVVKKAPAGRSKRFDIELENEVFLRGKYTKDVPGVPAQCLVSI